MRITIGNLSITPNVRTYTPPTKKRKYEPLQYHQTIPYILTHVTLILPVNGTKYIFRYLSKSCDTLEQHKLTPFPDCGIQEGLSAYKAGFLIPIIPPMPATLSSGTLINHHHQSSSSIIIINHQSSSSSSSYLIGPPFKGGPSRARPCRGSSNGNQCRLTFFSSPLAPSSYKFLRDPEAFPLPPPPPSDSIQGF